MGRAIAVELAARGARVAVLDIREDAARDVLEELDGGTGHHIAVTADVTSPAEVSQAIDTVIGALGGVDLLCNVAGVPDDATPCHEMSLAQWHQVLSIDLTGPFLVSRAVLPSMLARGGGAIVNVASIAGRNGGGPGAAAYATAKAGVITLTKGMAKELIVHGIRVNCVNPGVKIGRAHV